MTLKISLIGDIFPGELSFTRNYGIRSQFEQHKGSPWVEKIKEIVGENDLIIGNLESPLVENDNAIKDTFYGSPDLAPFLKECGINVLNVANNHILEQGERGFKSTVDVLNENDLGVVGNLEGDSSRILYKEIKGIKIAIAGFSNVDLHKIRNHNNFSILNEENVLTTLEIMKQQKADIKLFCFHWGNEYIHIPSMEQRKLAHMFIDAGIDIIVGHHPHVIQPYEKYKNGHIFYSLGNFMFDYIHSKMISIGLVATLELDNMKQVEVKLRGVKLSYKNTVSPLLSAEFEAFYSKISDLYIESCKNSDDNYHLFYSKMLHRNHFVRRVAMKTSLIKEFFNVSLKDKSFLLKNVFSYYTK